VRLIIIISSLLLSSSAFAQKLNWLPTYLNSKSLKCQLTAQDLVQQAGREFSQAATQIRENLKKRSPENQHLRKHSEYLLIATSPEAESYDFYGMMPMTVLRDNTILDIQTTRRSPSNDQIIVEGSLWIPFKIQDTGSQETCRIERWSPPQGHQNLVLSIDLVNRRTQDKVVANVYSLTTGSVAIKPNNLEKSAPTPKKKIKRPKIKRNRIPYSIPGDCGPYGCRSPYPPQNSWDELRGF
jgi:hypothetical protein